VCDKIAHDQHINATNIMHISCDYRIKRVRIVHSRYHDHSLNTEHNKVVSDRLTGTRCRVVLIVQLNHTGDMYAITSSMETSGFFASTLSHMEWEFNLNLDTDVCY